MSSAEEKDSDFKVLPLFPVGWLLFIIKHVDRKGKTAVFLSFFRKRVYRVEQMLYNNGKQIANAGKGAL